MRPWLRWPAPAQASLEQWLLTSSQRRPGSHGALLPRPCRSSGWPVNSQRRPGSDGEPVSIATHSQRTCPGHARAVVASQQLEVPWFGWPASITPQSEAKSLVPLAGAAQCRSAAPNSIHPGWGHQDVGARACAVSLIIFAELDEPRRQGCHKKGWSCVCLP